METPDNFKDIFDTLKWFDRLYETWNQLKQAYNKKEVSVQELQRLNTIINQLPDDDPDHLIEFFLNKEIDLDMVEKLINEDPWHNITVPTTAKLIKQEVIDYKTVIALIPIMKNASNKTYIWQICADIKDNKTTLMKIFERFYNQDIPADKLYYQYHSEERS